MNEQKTKLSPGIGITISLPIIVVLIVLFIIMPQVRDNDADDGISSVMTNTVDKTKTPDPLKDMWVCNGAEWVQQGNPTDSKPTVPCTPDNAAFPTDQAFEYHWSEMNEGPYHDTVTFATGTDLTHWTPTGITLAEHASVPAAVIKDGVIYTYFVDVTTEGLPEQLGMVMSSDQGKTWSERKILTIQGIGDKATADPDPVLLADGRIRLYYFDINDTRINGTTDGIEPSAKIYSAISEDGINFTQEDGVRFERAAGVYDPDVNLYDGVWYLYGGVSEGNQVIYATSSDGLTFTEQGVAYQGGGVPDVYYGDGTYYLFTAGIDISTGTTPTAFTGTSDQFRDQNSEGATADPSVVQLDDGSYLMVYKIQ